jgi:hypothetical protein
MVDDAMVEDSLDFVDDIIAQGEGKYTDDV